MVKSLLDVNAGDEVTIVKYNDGGNTDLKRHLLFKIKGYDVCLRKEEAKNIIVE